jgi:hypothetical protein
MITRRRAAAAFFIFGSLLAAIGAACDKVPLLAPSGSVITIFATATTVPVNGSVEIVATVIENGTAQTPSTPTTPGQPGTPTTPTTPTSTPGAGTPVHNGTVVSFTTTLGRIEPREARTQNGEVRVRFHADGQSGIATITAFSGGASGRLENVRVGTAGAERVVLTATPQALSPTGGNTEIRARVEDVSGAPIGGVPVNFSTSFGTLSSGTATTDSGGVASTTLTTTRDAEVTANVAGKTASVKITLNPRTGITITPPTGNVSAGLPAVFTVAVAAGTTGANIRDVTIDFGDGRTQSLGALSAQTTVPHVYSEPGTYTVKATATDSSGFSEFVTTAVNILPAQPPGVTITVSDTTPVVNQIITVTANVTGATSTILQYQWDFGDGRAFSTTGNQTTISYPAPGTKIIRVRVVQAVGPAGEGQTAVEVGLGAAVRR